MALDDTVWTLVPYFLVQDGKLDEKLTGPLAELGLTYFAMDTGFRR